MRNIVTVILVMMLAGLQYRLWIADGGISHTHRLHNDIRAENETIERLRARNAALEAEIADLKSGVAAIESRARQSLGMVRQGETFYLVVRGG